MSGLLERIRAKEAEAKKPAPPPHPEWRKHVQAKDLTRAA